MPLFRRCFVVSIIFFLATGCAGSPSPKERISPQTKDAQQLMKGYLFNVQKFDGINEEEAILLAKGEIIFRGEQNDYHLEHPEVSFNNNLAERMIRHHVILRNRSFQNRSEQGAAAHETLMSLLHTLRLQDKNPLTFLKKAYLKHRQGNPLPILRIASVG